MASTNSGSEFKFLDPTVTTQYQCSVCNCIARDPWRPDCCGSLYCNLCTGQGNGSSTDKHHTTISYCVHCRTEFPKFEPEQDLKEKMNRSKVACPHKGCKWTGELVKSEFHATKKHASVVLLYCNATAMPESSTKLQQPSQSENCAPDQPPVPSSHPKSIGVKREVKSEERVRIGNELNVQSEEDAEEVGPAHFQTRIKHWKMLCHCSSIFADHSLYEKLCFVAGLVMTSMWLVLVIPISIIVLMESVSKVRSHNVSLVPGCDYSVTLLWWLVILVQVGVAVCLLAWYSRCHKCIPRKRYGRGVLTILCILTVIYILVSIGFGVSVFWFTNRLTDMEQAENGTSLIASGSGASGYSDMEVNSSINSGSGRDLSGYGGGGGSGSMWNSSNDKNEEASRSGSAFQNVTEGNETSLGTGTDDMRETEVCTEVLSKPFIIALAFILQLLVFIVAVTCILAYEYSYNGICYRRTRYNPDVQVLVFENDDGSFPLN